ncbi:MAG: GNAT family N-acetyltransferase [Chloroflexota bacterium]|nr:MAG: GNAT family N-acetyltransferase [Chloroflexota bacterium]
MDNRNRVEVLGDQAKQGFSCGVDALDRYLLRQASQDQRKEVAVAYLLMDREAEKVAGYYTLSAASVRSDKLPENMRVKLPRHEELPTALIGRLAVDHRYQGHRLGGFLLLDALLRCLDTSEKMGLLAVTVDAKDDRARAFYEAFEFRRFIGEEYHLYLPVAKIRSLT